MLTENPNVKVLDVRLIEDLEEVEHPVPGAQWKNPKKIEQWSKELDGADEVIVYCVHGHHISQNARDGLRERGIKSRIVEGGIEGWCDYIRKKT